ncbi:hypothetical protein Goshw_008886, partial [Gossypium schwendimanii]|nr:hypothetical protein [Gossypium schwendimanii]
TENPLPYRLCYQRLRGSRNRRALILGWAYYLDAFTRKGLLNVLIPTPDMDRTVSQCSEPSSRTALMGEQSNPWNILQPQVAKSRQLGNKPSRRCELLRKISLLSLE